MSSLKTGPQDHIFSLSPLGFPALNAPVRVLVVSPRIEVRRPLLRVVEACAGEVIVCSTLCEAEDALSRTAFQLVFCDEYLPDGSYGDLIHPDHFSQQIPRVVVATRNGEWELYFDALRRGAFDVVRSPWHPTDLEMVVIRALREEQRAEPSVNA